MKLLFSSRPLYGHLYPLMPLAFAARSAGHDVAFTTGRQFTPKLRAQGFPTFVAGIGIDEAYQQVLATGLTPTGEDGRPNLEFGGSLFIEAFAPNTVDDLLPLLHLIQPDVVIYEQGDVGAAVAAHVTGIPSVCHSISPQMPAEVRQIVGGERFPRLWAKYGVTLPPFDPLVGHRYIDIFPSSLQEPSFANDPARIVMRPMPWSEPGFGIPAAARQRHRPLVYLTLGTVVATDDVLQPAIDGLASLDADVIVALGAASGADLGRLPDNIHVEAFVDQAALMNHVDLVVHHGGSGTILAALASSVPQVLLPKGADQFLNADRMIAAGLAAVLVPADATADSIAMAAKAALAESDRSAIDAARAEIEAMPAPDDVVDDLVTLFG